MTPNSPPATVATGLVLLLVAYLVRERGWTSLVAGVRNGGLPFPDWTAEVVGAYTAVVGAGTVALGALASVGAAPAVLETTFAAVVAVSAVTLPFWAPRYVRWRVDRATTA